MHMNQKRLMLVQLILKLVHLKTLLSCSGPSVWSSGEVPEAPHRFHQSAAVRAGEPVQTQQIPVQTQTL